MIRRLLLICPILLLVATAGAQTELSLNQRKAAAETIDNVFSDYISASDFKELGYTGFSQNKINKFTALFDSGVVIHDDLSPVSINDLTTSDKNVAQYISDLKQNFPAGIKSMITKANINLKELNRKKVEVVFERSVSGSYKSGQFFQDKQSVMVITFRLSDDYKSAKITGITKSSSNLKCPECPVQALAEVNKQKPEKPSKPDKVEKPSKPEKTEKPDKTLLSQKTNKEKPQNDIIVQEVKPKKEKQPKGEGGNFGVALALNLSGPGNFSATSAPDVSKFNYPILGNPGINSLVKDSSFYSGFSNKPGLSFSAGLDLDLMFGKKKNIGVGIGAMYNYSSSTMHFDTMQLFYNAENSGNKNFLRILAPGSINENISTSSFALNVLFKYQGDVNSKIGYYMHAGPVMVFSTSATSNYSTDITYSSVYQYRNRSYDEYDATGSIQSSDVQVTVHQYETTGRELTPYEFYARHARAGFDVAYDSLVTGSKSFNYKMGFGALIRGGITFHCAKQLDLNLGASVMWTQVTGNDQLNAVLSAKQADELGKYNSVLHTVDNLSNINVGLHLGLVYKFFKSK